MKKPRIKDRMENLPKVPAEESVSTVSRDIIQNILADFSDTGKITHRMGTHLHQYSGVAVAADGSRMITTNRDYTARLWDIASGQCLMVFRGHTDELRRAAFIGDGCYALTTGIDGTLRMWECATGKCIRTMSGHKGNVPALAVSPDEKFMVSGGFDKTLRVWSLPGGACEQVVTQNDTIILRVLFTMDGKTLVTLDTRGIVRRWNFPDIGSPFQINEMEILNRINDIALIGDGKLIAAKEPGLCWFDIHTGEKERVFSLEPYKSQKVIVAPDGSLLVSCYLPEVTIYLVDQETGVIKREFKGHKDDVTEMAITPDGITLCTVSLDWTCRIWDTRNGKCMRTVKNPASNVILISISGDGRYLAGVDESGTVKLWDLCDGSQRIVCRDVWSIASLLLPNLLATGHKDGRVCLWDYNSDKDKAVAVLEAHTNQVSCLLPFQSGNCLATGARDGIVKIWDTRSLACIRTISIPGIIDSLAVDENEERIVVGRRLENHIWIYDLDSGEKLAVMKGHKRMADCPSSPFSTIQGLYFLPGGRHLVSCSDDGCIILWDSKTFEAVHTIEEPGRAIFSMDSQDDGRHIVIGTLTGGVKKWDPLNRKSELCWLEEGLVVLAVALSLDEKTLFAAFSDGAIRIIDMQSTSLISGFWNIQDGFFWFTPPDRHAPDGWVWTDRDDLIHVLEQDKKSRILSAVPFNDEKRQAYIHIRNNAEMVQARLKGLDEYKRIAKRYLLALAKKQQETVTHISPMLPMRAEPPCDRKSFLSQDAGGSEEKEEWNA